MQNLRRVRTISQADLARLVGISQQSLSKIEQGLLVPSLDVQDRIAAVLGVSRGRLGFARKKTAALQPQERERVAP